MRRVGVIGGGLMGSGIAETVAIAELEVVVREVNETAVGHARARVGASLEKALAAQKLDPGRRNAALARITFTVDPSELAGVDLVIEAVPEDLDLKTQIYEGTKEIQRLVIGRALRG